MINDVYIDVVDYYISEGNSPFEVIKFCQDLNKNRVIAKLFANKKLKNNWVILFPDLSGIAIIFYEDYYVLFKLLIEDIENFKKYYELWDVINNVEN
jgi:hypothetical protein